MTIPEVFKQKPIDVEEKRIKELKRLKERGIFISMSGMLDFFIEWQEVTGELLYSDPRTREKGEEKLKDVKKRKQERKILRQKGVLK